MNIFMIMNFWIVVTFYSMNYNSYNISFLNKKILHESKKKVLKKKNSLPNFICCLYYECILYYHIIN